MRTTSVGVFKVATKGPGDVSGLMSLIGSGAIDPASILAILGKTEGNGGVNDFTREYAVAALCTALAPKLGLTPHEVEQRIAFVMSGGTEGVLSPHITVFTRQQVETPPAGISGKRLSIGMAQTRDFLPEELGRSAQITETAKAVKAAMADAGITDRRRCPFRSDQVPAAHQRPCRGGSRARQQDGDDQRLQLDGLFARRLRARGCRRARRDRRPTSAMKSCCGATICSRKSPRPRPASS